MKNRFNNEPLAQMKNLLLIIFIIIDLIFIVAITLFDLPADDIAFMAYFDLFVCLILFLNLINTYRHSEDNLTTFLKKHIIDIISMIPFNFIFLRYLTIFRVFRILQFFQIIRIFNISKINIHSFKYFVQNQLLKTLAIILIIYMVLASIILFVLDTSFLSVFDSFWYNIVTVTGVGYGDVTPDTHAGKIIGILTIIIGVLFISVFTAAMSAMYMEKPEENTRNTIINYHKHVKEENKKLKNEIDEIKKETEELNKKIDYLTDLLENS